MSEDDLDHIDFGPPFRSMEYEMTKEYEAEELAWMKEQILAAEELSSWDLNKIKKAFVKQFPAFSKYQADRIIRTALAHLLQEKLNEQT